MYNISALKKYIAVLLVQDVVLFLISAVGAYGLIFWRAYAPELQIWFIAGVFSAALLTAALLLAVWNILNSLTEGLWSIRAKARVQKWLIFSLYLSIFSSFFALVWVWRVTTFGAESSMIVALSPYFLSFSLIMAAVLPLMASALLSAGAFKHLIGVRKTSARMLSSVAGGHGALDRIAVSVQSDAGNSATSARPHPKGFYVAGLTSKPWHESEEFEWLKTFEESFNDILSEATAVLGQSLEDLEHYHYPGIDTEHWRIFSFVADRKENAKNIEKCPVTAKALQSIPGYPFFRDAMFSILEPGGVIKPHRDHTNLFLTMHFGLMTPDEGYMEVAGMRRPWREGQAIFFDSSFEHQAVNASDKPRVILLADFLHPQLTEAERAWVTSAPLWRDNT